MSEKLLFFEHEGERLFAVLHLPDGGPPAAGVVVCAPFADEAFRAHRELVVFARLMASAGFAVLRFDYRGTGDSSGHFHSFEPRDWCSDIGRAIGELQARLSEASGAAPSGGEERPRIVLMGLRMGAALCAALTRQDPRVDGLILWSPLRPGTQLEEIRRWLAMRALVAANGGEKALAAAPWDEGRDTDLGGYLLTTRAALAMRAFDPWDDGCGDCPTLFVELDKDRSGRADRDEIAGRYSRLRRIQLDERPFWVQKIYQRPQVLYDATLSWLAELQAERVRANG